MKNLFNNMEMAVKMKKMYNLAREILSESDDEFDYTKDEDQLLDECANIKYLYENVAERSNHKNYFIYDTAKELHNHLKYWSNSCGDLFHFGGYELSDISELPAPLQRAYTELWQEGNGCLEYLTQFEDEYYIALVTEFDSSFASDLKMSLEEVFYIATGNAMKMQHTNLFKNTVLVIGKETGCDGCHEIIFLVPAMESKNIYDEIEDTIYRDIFEM